MSYKLLSEQANRVLQENKRGDITVPSPTNYPHQFLWDTAVTSIGLAHSDPERARREIEHLLTAQWKTGMIPHQVFERGRFFGQPKKNFDYLFWRVQRYSEDSPKSIDTSGITQPPVLAESVSVVAEKLEPESKKEFLKKSVPALIKFHNWLYICREYNGNGLLSCIHSWETGLDNTPPWMEVTKQTENNPLAKLAKSGLLDRVSARLRRDLRETTQQERTQLSDGLLLASSALEIIKLKYDDSLIASNRTSSSIEDVGFNSLLIRNNRILKQLAQEIDIDLPEHLKNRMTSTEDNFSKFWDDETRMFYSRRTSTGEFIKIPTISSIFPIYSGAASEEQNEDMLQSLRDPQKFGGEHGIPSVAIEDPHFQDQQMWQGPAWPLAERFVIDGLDRLGKEGLANNFRHKLLGRAAINGIFEYYSPKTGRGFGIRKFSPSAAVILDSINKL